MRMLETACELHSNQIDGVKVVDLIETLKDILLKVPEEYRETLELSEQTCNYFYFGLEYYRPKTQEEVEEDRRRLEKYNAVKTANVLEEAKKLGLKLVEE